MSLSSVSSALSLNERWVLLHRQPRGPRKGPTRLLLIPPLHPSDLQSSKELTARRSASVRLLHLHNLISPSLQQQQRWGGIFVYWYCPCLHVKHILRTSLLIKMTPTYICTVLAHILASYLTLFLSEGRTLMLFS